MKSLAASLVVLLASAPLSASQQSSRDLPSSRWSRAPIRESAVSVTNTGFAGSLTFAVEQTTTLGNRFAALPVSEADQGLTDLNGNGVLDRPVFIWDIEQGTAENTGLSVSLPFPILDSGNAVLLVDEVVQDLNGDGDTFDQVLHLHDMLGQATDNQGFASRFVTTRSGTLVALLEETGADEDFTGDGDQLDRALDIQLLGKRSGLRPPQPGISLQTLGPRLASSGAASLVLDDDFGLAGISEQDQGKDLNGDGDLLDNVVHRIDARSGAITNLRQAGNYLTLSGNIGAFRTPEVSQGVDLNGDGDLGDEVLHVLDVATGALSNLGLAVTLIHAQENAVAVLVDEGDHGGEDLNGDGDADDQVVFTWTPSSGISNLGLATSRLIGGSGNGLIVPVSELAQGTDLNGDGDLDDHVLHENDLASGATINVGTAILPLQVGERFVLIPISERGQGLDFNFDGDADDDVLGIYDGAHDRLVNTGLAVFGLGYALREHGSRLLFGVFETAQGATDLNGDGDSVDQVAFVYDGEAQSLTDLELAFYALLTGNEVRGSRALIYVTEASQGSVDLNGDGDTIDSVAHLIELP